MGDILGNFQTVSITLLRQNLHSTIVRALNSFLMGVKKWGNYGRYEARQNSKEMLDAVLLRQQPYRDNGLFTRRLF